MTIKQAKLELKKIGVSLGWRPEAGEYRVKVIGAPRGVAEYFTNDLEDALDTARLMVLERELAAKKETGHD